MKKKSIKIRRAEQNLRNLRIITREGGRKTHQLYDSLMDDCRTRVKKAFRDGEIPEEVKRAPTLLLAIYLFLKDLGREHGGDRRTCVQ